MTVRPSKTVQPGSSLGAIFAGRRGRLLTALLVTEFGAAVQSIAYSTVLPIASRELGGSALYGATLAAGSFAMILVLATGPGPLGRLSSERLLLVGTVMYVVGVLLAATAVSMTYVLAGAVVRGLASGLLAGFGLTAIGALFEDAVRPRVFGLFALVWLLPSLAGPVLNALVAVAAGWRWAMGWPAAVVLIGRMLIARDSALIPWRRATKQRLAVVPGAVLLIALVVAAAAPAGPGALGVLLLGVGVACGIAASVWTLHAQVRSQTGRLLTTVSLFGLCLAFFGSESILSLAVIEGLHRGVVAAGVTVAAALVGWSLTGLRPPGFDAHLGDATMIGLAVLAGTLMLTSGTQIGVVGRGAALAVIVGSSAMAGVGMGLSYPRILSEAMNDMPTQEVAGAANAAAFAETSGTAVGALLAGGIFSVASAAHIPAHRSLAWSFLLLAATALLTLAVSAWGHHHQF